MRKILSTLMLLLTVAFLSFGQDIRPIGATNLQSPSFSVYLPDGSIYIWKNSTLGFTKLLSADQVQQKVDSLSNYTVTGINFTGTTTKTLTLTQQGGSTKTATFTTSASEVISNVYGTNTSTNVQGDINNIEDNKVPYDGANRDVSLGNKTIKSISFISDTTYVSTGIEKTGTRYYDSENKTTTLILPNGVKLQDGQEDLILVYNNSGVDIPDQRAVYRSGAFNDFPTVALAKADNVATSDVLGISTHIIKNNDYGFLTERGKIHNLNTSLYSANDTLWLSAVSAGEATKIKPTDTGQIPIKIGNVNIVGTTTGSIEVDIETLIIDERLLQPLNTGYLNGLDLSINVDNTKFNIAAGFYVVTDYSAIINPKVMIIHFLGVTGITPTYLASANATYIALDKNKNIIQSDHPFSDAQRRGYAIIGAVIHSNRTFINVVNQIKAPLIGDVNQLHDLMRAIGTINKFGNEYGENGANLFINKTAGSIFGLGINASDYTDPHVLNIAEQIALTFRYRLQTGTEYPNTQSIDPDHYDLNGVLALANNNKFTIQRINLFQSGLTRIQYGQNVYASMNEAMTFISSDPFVVEQNIAENAIFRCYLAIKQGVTDIAVAVASGDAKFIPVDKFGNVQSGGGISLTYATIIAALGYTPENIANKVTSISGSSTDIQYPSAKLVYDQLGLKEPTVTKGVLSENITGLEFTNPSIQIIGNASTLTASSGYAIPTTINIAHGETGYDHSVADADLSLSNEGQLTVATGTANTSIINSNTSGQTGVIIGVGGINTISESGNTLTITATEVDGSVTNEIQDISTTGAAGNITLSSGSTLNLNVNDADASVLNEIQAPTRVGDLIGLTQTITTIDISDKAPASGSGNYIWNGTSQQPTSNYNVSGYGYHGGNIQFGNNNSGATSTPSQINSGLNFSNGTTRDKLKYYLYNDGGVEQYGFGFGSSGDIQYHSNTTHDFYINNTKKVAISTSGVNSNGYLLNDINLFSSLSSGYIPYWDGTKFPNSIISQTDSRIGIGTSPLAIASNPAQLVKLSLLGDQFNGQFLIRENENSPYWGAGIWLQKEKGLNGAVANGSTLGNIYFGGSDGTSQVNTSLITSYVDGSVSTGNVPSALSFYTGTTGLNQRMTISSSGNIGVGTAIQFAQFQSAKDAAFTDGANAQGIFSGAGVNPRYTAIGFDTTNDFGYIQSAHQNVTWAKNLKLQPNGGTVSIGNFASPSTTSVIALTDGTLSTTTEHASVSYADSKIAQTITNGVTTTAPSEDAVYDGFHNIEITDTKSTGSTLGQIATSNGAGGIEMKNPTLSVSTFIKSQSATGIFNQAHSSIVLNDQLFIGERAANPKIVKFTDLDNLGTYTSTTVTGTGVSANGLEYGYYVSSIGKICFTSKNPTSGIDIVELTPSTMAYAIHNFSTISANYSVSSTDGTYIYIANLSYIKKIRVSDWTEVASVAKPSNIQFPHAMQVNVSRGELYLTGSIADPIYMAKVNTSDLSYTEIDLSAYITHATDDMCFYDDGTINKVFIGGESFVSTEQYCGVVVETTNSNALSFIHIKPSYGLFIDGVKVYNCSIDGYIQTFSALDPDNVSTFLLEGYKPNEVLAASSGRTFLTHWDATASVMAEFYVPVPMPTLSALTNPMINTGDLIVANPSSTPTRLGIGSSGQVLTVSGGLPSWQNASSGFTDPMTNIGDLITRNASNVTARLGVGTNGQLLGTNGTTVSWVNAPSGTSQWTTDTYGITYANNIGVGAASLSVAKIYGYSTNTGVWGGVFENTGIGGYGVWIKAANTGANSLYVTNYNGTKDLLKVDGGGDIYMSNLASDATPTDIVYWNTSTGKLTHGAKPSGGGAAGTVTSFSSSNFSPLFTTAVSNPTTTPALSFTAVSQAANTVYAAPNGASGVPSFRKVVVGDISATGTPSSSTAMFGDGSWKAPGDITSVVAGTGMSGGGTSGDVTLNLSNTAVTPGSYTNANITVDAQGRITTANNGAGSVITSGTEFTGASGAILDMVIGGTTFEGEYEINILIVDEDINGMSYWKGISYLKFSGGVFQSNNIATWHSVPYNGISITPSNTDEGSTYKVKVTLGSLTDTHTYKVTWSLVPLSM